MDLPRFQMTVLQTALVLQSMAVKLKFLEVKSHLTVALLVEKIQVQMAGGLLLAQERLFL